MLLRLQKYNLNVTYTRGKDLYIADTLSRATPEFHMQKPSKLVEEIAHIQQAEWIRKVTDSRLNQIRDLTNKDENLQSLKTVILSGWLNTKEDVPIPIRLLRQIIVKVRNNLFKGPANKRQITIITNVFII